MELPGAFVFLDLFFLVQAEIMNAANNPEVGPAHTADFWGMWDLDVALGCHVVFDCHLIQVPNFQKLS